MTLPPLEWTTALHNLGRIALAYGLALPIGWERERAVHSTGIRTFPIVAVASCGYIMVARHALGDGSGNLDRVVQGLMTGIGFVGGGAIVKHGTTVRGSATAASIWNMGAVGAAVALGSYDMAVLLALVNFLTLHYLAPIRQQLSQGEGEDGPGTDTRRTRRKKNGGAGAGSGTSELAGHPKSGAGEEGKR